MRSKISNKIRKKMNRSGTLECDICKNKDVPLQRHHINGKNIVEPNHPSNLANLCPNCHFLIHNEKIIIEQWVKTTKGLELLWHEKEDPSFSGQDSKPYLIP